MSRSEELQLIARVQNGYSDAEAQLLALYEGFLVKAIAHLAGAPYIEAFGEDLMQEAQFGVIEAARKFNPAKETRLVTLIRWRVRNRVLEWIRKERISKGLGRDLEPAVLLASGKTEEEILDGLRPCEWNPEKRWIDEGLTPMENALAVEHEAQVKNALASVHENDWQILHMMVIDPRPPYLVEQVLGTWYVKAFHRVREIMWMIRYSIEHEPVFTMDHTGNGGTTTRVPAGL